MVLGRRAVQRSRTLCKSSKRWEPRVGMLAHGTQSLRGPARTRHRSFSQRGSQALGYKLAITPVWVVLFTAPPFFFFVSVKLCLSCISQFALRANNLPGQEYTHSSPTSVSGPFNWGSMTVWLARDNGLCVPPNVNPEKCHTWQFLKTCRVSAGRCEATPCTSSLPAVGESEPCRRAALRAFRLCTEAQHSAFRSKTGKIKAAKLPIYMPAL